jgi:hypothetical protein
MDLNKQSGKQSPGQDRINEVLTWHTERLVCNVVLTGVDIELSIAEFVSMIRRDFV